MKKIILYLFFCLLVIQLVAQKSLPKPNPMRLVNDYAKLLDGYDAEKLEKKLVAFDDSTSNQIVVLTIPSLNGEVIEEVAVKTFREWGIGNKKNNNGVLLLVALAEKKIRIEVGYGLEGAIPDVVANDIINNDIKPAFKQSNYLEGINKAVDDLCKAAAGEYKVKRDKKGIGNNTSGGSILLFIIILIVVIVIVGGNSGGRGRGGRIGASDIILPIIFSNLGRGSGNGSGWSDSGGGFGGFGGGSSGGGGASGGW